MKALTLITLVVLSLLISGCDIVENDTNVSSENSSSTTNKLSNQSSSSNSTSTESNASFTIYSNDLIDDGYMDNKFGAKYKDYQSVSEKGQNISPHIGWNSVEGANSYALEMSHTSYHEAHWAIINIPANITELPQNVDKDYVTNHPI